MVDRPVFVDGIGPPLQQIAEDYRELTDFAVGGAAEDVLALIAAVMALLSERDILREAVAAYLAALDTEGIADADVLRVAVPDTEKRSNE